MQKLIVLLILSFISITTFSQSEQLFAELGDLELISGKTLNECKIGYRTFGELNSDSSNIVIYPTWFGGTSGAIAGLIGPKHIAGQYGKDKLVDDTKFFVIAIDALGNGVSTSPSNSESQKGMEFPKITIDDMINSQYKMLTEVFGFKHIHAIIGGSMGSMQALQWIVTYPNFIDKAVAYVASPRRSTYDKLVMEFRKKMIDSYREFGADDTFVNVMINYINQLFVRTPEYIIENINHDNFESFIDEKIKKREPSKTFTIDNHLAQLQAMMTHNIYKDFNNSVVETAKHIRTEVFLILSQNDMLVHPAPALELADALDCEVLMLENNCGHLGVGCEIANCGWKIHRFLTEKKRSECAKYTDLIFDIMGHQYLDKNPELVKPIEEIQAEFDSLVDSVNFSKVIYAKVIIDSTGNVICSEIVKGLGNYVDSVAIDFVKTLKFYPAERRYFPDRNKGGLVKRDNLP
ncbi:MAG: alpha/beta hydrolase, partial [Bacteroidota bacterium]